MKNKKVCSSLSTASCNCVGLMLVMPVIKVVACVAVAVSSVGLILMKDENNRVNQEIQKKYGDSNVKSNEERVM